MQDSTMGEHVTRIMSDIALSHINIRMVRRDDANIRDGRERVPLGMRAENGPERIFLWVIPYVVVVASFRLLIP